MKYYAGSCEWLAWLGCDSDTKHSLDSLGETMTQVPHRTGDGVDDEQNHLRPEEEGEQEGGARQPYNPGGLLRGEPPPFCGASPEPLKK